MQTITVPDSCFGCGACCVGLKVEVTPQDDVPDALFVYDTGEFVMKQRKGICIAFNRKTKTCNIYANRPNECREFERGGVQCIAVLTKEK